jgi:hypothetical protein
MLFAIFEIVGSSRGSAWRPTGPFYNHIPTPTDELITPDDDDDVDTPPTTSQSPPTPDGTIPPGTASPPPTAASLPTEIVLPTWNELRQLAGNWPTALAGFLDFVAPTFQSLANNATTTTTTMPSPLPTTAEAQPIYAVPIVVPYRNNKKVIYRLKIRYRNAVLGIENGEYRISTTEND